MDRDEFSKERPTGPSTTCKLQCRVVWQGIFVVNKSLCIGAGLLVLYTYLQIELLASMNLRSLAIRSSQQQVYVVPVLLHFSRYMPANVLVLNLVKVILVQNSHR